MSIMIERSDDQLYAASTSCKRAIRGDLTKGES